MSIGINRSEAQFLSRLHLRQLANPGLLTPFLEAKVQATFPKDRPTKAILVVYVDARAVASILDRIIGPEAWSFCLLQSPMHTDQGWTCHGRLTIDGRIHREDLGTGSGNAEMGGKGAASDALKRCAAQLGVGRALYALEPITAPCDDRKRVAPAEMQSAIAAWRAQLERWADKFRAGDAGSEAPPAPMDDELPELAPPASGGGASPAAPASSADTAPPAPAQGGLGAARDAAPSAEPAPDPGVPAGPSLSPGKAQFLTLMEELGIPANHANRAHAIKALTAAGITSDVLTDAKRIAEAREVLRVAFAVPLTASQVIEVQSETDPKVKHKVTLTRRDADTRATCECEGFKFNGLCPHQAEAWNWLGLGGVLDPPIPQEPWKGIDLVAVAKAASEAHAEAFPEAAARRKQKMSAHDEAVADAAFGDEPAPEAA